MMGQETTGETEPEAALILDLSEEELEATPVMFKD